MSLNNNFDTGPLTWVKDEIDIALGQARENLALATQNPESKELLRYAQNFVHQASGALSVVGLDGVIQFAEATDRFLSTLVSGAESPSVEKIQLADRGVVVLTNYIAELLAGAPHQPLRLFPLYRELASASGYEEPLPNELFFPDLNLRLVQAPPFPVADWIKEMKGLRSNFEKGLLGWLRQPNENIGLSEMLQVVKRLEQIQDAPAIRAFWWSTIAFFEGLVLRAIGPSRQAYRVCRRIDTQMRRLIDGSKVVAERLARDVLYFVATASIDTDHAHFVRQTYRLDELLPVPGSDISETPRWPLMQNLREMLEQAKELWNRFSAGEAAALPAFQERYMQLVACATPMRIMQIDRLLAEMGKLIVWLRADPLRFNDGLAMDIATGLLVIEQTTTELVVGDLQALRHQTDTLCERYIARCRREILPTLDDSFFNEASRRNQSKLFFDQLAREILANLGQVEQTLEAFFRNAETRSALSGLIMPLKQIEGAFAILGEASAQQLVREGSERIEAFAVAEELPLQAECDELAYKLSALGFYVEALRSGPARLENFLQPTSAIGPRVQDPSDSVEVELVRETRETCSLLESYKHAPNDSELRDQLVGALDSIREGAHLVANVKLEQQARRAIHDLKAGGEFSGQVQEMLSGAAPSIETPQPSEEATRLMAASSEEFDAELLGIFLEEAKEVLETQKENRERAVQHITDREALTTVRRGFHTLKGSSRMVGLQAFSEAARYVEMAMNRWLQLEKNVDKEIIALIDEGRETFVDWVAQLDDGKGSVRDASSLIEHAQKLLASLDVNLFEGSTVEAAQVSREPMRTAGTPPAAFVRKETEFLSLESRLTNPISSNLNAHVELRPQPTTDVEDFFAFADLASTSLMADFDALMTHGPEASDLDFSASNIGVNTFLGLDGEVNDSVGIEPAGLTSTTLFFESVIESKKKEPGASGKSGNLGIAPFLIESIPTEEQAVIEDGAEGSLDVDLSDEALVVDSDADMSSAALTATSLAFHSGDEKPAKSIQKETSTSLGIEPLFLDVTEDDSGRNAEALPFSGEAALGFEAQEGLPKKEIPVNHVLDKGLEIVSIGTEEDDAFELPRLELPPLPVEQLLTESVDKARAAKVEADIASENDVVIGGHTLSRALYTLYLSEARQHLATLKEEHERMTANPLHVPTQQSIRAAHTLAGISGTARIQPPRELAKALEQGLSRFFEGNKAPDRNQVVLIGIALKSIDNMVGEIEQIKMPLDAKEIVDQLDVLRPPTPLYDSPQLASLISRSEEDEPRAERVEAKDEVDPLLLPIFLDESEELISDLGGILRTLRTDVSNSGAQQGLARLLHTLKGSSRMAGAMRLGEYVHSLETRLQNGQMDLAMTERLEQAFDHINAMISALRHPGSETPEAPQLDETRVLLEQFTSEHVSEEEGVASEEASKADALDEISIVAPPIQSGKEQDAETTTQSARPTLRVRADLIDRFVNEAGEISIARTRVESEMQTLRRSLLDLTENVIRLRNQLREVEIQAESQMQSRIAAAEAQHAEFDPLEFDRFTRLQELTRMMAESVGDVTTIQQNLLRNLDSADSSLSAQARLSRDLQQALMGVRMVPFEDTVDRLYRVVRQSARELGKRANLDISGGIEIDRGMLDRMMAPLEHLLRNAIAHGIETPAERVAAGKPEAGRITLILNQQSNEISIELSDDGRGLNYERILVRGRASGLVKPDEEPSEARLAQLIFEPSFSTAEKVSGMAGRGVGLDVVKNETLAVGGRIETTSTIGRGTCFMIHLPLTLALSQALLMRVNERTYAVPSNMVEQAMELKESALQEARDRGYVERNGQQYALLYLPRVLGDTKTMPVPGRIHAVLLLRAGNQRVALHVDELCGNQEVIVKNAGPQFVRLQGFTGATVLPDGEIALILNPVVLAGLIDPEALKYNLGVASTELGNRIPLIMVVDDSLTVRKFTSRLLEREGFRVITAKDGVDALEQLADIKPDVMLLDIEMPRMDGFDLTRNIRTDERLRDLPIIMITSRMADKHRNYAKEIGVNHYLGKPYQEDRLLELIKAFLHKP